MTLPDPLSVVANDLRTITEDELAHGFDFDRVYGDFTLYGDVQYVYSKVYAAFNVRVGEDHSVNEHQVNADRRQLRPDLVAGELAFALERCETALGKLEDVDDDPYNLQFKFQKAKETIKKHKDAAERGVLFHV